MVGASVVLDEDATQKYVLIEAYPDDSGETPTYLVRGSRHAKYHKDAAKETLEALEVAAVPHRVLGGGWCNHDAYLRTVEFYGRSQGYPWEGEPRHDIAVEVCAMALGPDFTVGIKDDAEAEPPHGSAAARGRMYALMAGCILGLKVVRAAFPSIIPFMVAENSFSDAQQASLLSSFWLGYATSPLLGAPIVQKYGGKGIMTVAMGSTGVLTALLPLAARSGGAAALSAIMVAMGMAQGPLAPALSELNRVWMPLGTERIWAQRAQAVAHHCTTLIAAWATPRLCTIGGWPLACRVYGHSGLGLTLLWQLFARARPHDQKKLATTRPNGVTELEPIGLLGPLPARTKYLRPREEWKAIAESESTKWFVDHRGPQATLPMLEDDYLFQNPDDPAIVPYLPKGHRSSDKRTAILIMPGGGYHWLAPFEGPPIGQWCAEHGIVGFVLRYRLLREDANGRSIGYTKEDALADATAAMRYIRKNASSLGVDPRKVGAMGFSAGGDLCIRTGLSTDPLVKPDFLCPVYPAVPVHVRPFSL